ncbi:MAG: hypothetical protein ACJ710_06445 [Ornithinibacter sp.]
MGSDPRRLDGLRADEQVAARLVERATGATARAHDIGRRQGAYDVHLTYPSGRTAALEVTTHAGAATRNGMVLLGRERLSRNRTRPRPSGEPLPADPVLTALPDAVSDLLAEPHVARRAAKVAEAGRVDERHLFVGVAEGGLPEPLYERLNAPLGALPTEPPVVPDGLTHLWLSTEWRGSPLLAWDRVGGWVAHQV